MNSDQIEQSHDRTIDDAVFRSAMQPISVNDVEVADGKSITLDQGRQEPMHRVEIWETQKDVPAKSLEPTSDVTCIVELAKREPIRLACGCACLIRCPAASPTPGSAMSASSAGK